MSKRVCPSCGGRKDYYAAQCRRCAPANRPLQGVNGDRHPAWKGGQDLDRDGYVRTYAPQHPWPRSGGYVRENVRVMELHLGRQLTPDEVVHHKDHDRRNNSLDNLELQTRGDHSRLHRAIGAGPRARDAHGRFA